MPETGPAAVALARKLDRWAPDTLAVNITTMVVFPPPQKLTLIQIVRRRDLPTRIFRHARSVDIVPVSFGARSFSKSKVVSRV
jgi:hypothetical protein